GANLAVDFAISNRGNEPANERVPLQIYLSSDPALSSDDIHVATTSINLALLPLTQLKTTMSVRVPAKAAGKYYIFADLHTAEAATSKIQARNDIASSSKTVAITAPEAKPAAARTSNLMNTTKQIFALEPIMPAPDDEKYRDALFS